MNKVDDMICLAIDFLIVYALAYIVNRLMGFRAREPIIGIISLFTFVVMEITTKNYQPKK